MHFIWSLPPGDADYSKRMGQVKVHFTKAFYMHRPRPAAVTDSRKKHRESDIWQPRFWEHTISDEDEFERVRAAVRLRPLQSGQTRARHMSACMGCD